MADRIITCLRCGEFAERVHQSHTGICGPCSRLRHLERSKAINEVYRRMKYGALERASEHACADCGKPAVQWDHRDYTKPLEVEPVCRSCNQTRPVAYDSAYRPTANGKPQDAGKPSSRKGR